MICAPKRAIAWLVFIALGGTFSGCWSRGPETIPVQGIVTLDGKPVEGATVSFSPKAAGRPATGTTDAAGHFSLTTFEPGDGAVPGEHVVTVSKIKSSGQQFDMSTIPAGRDVMPLSGPTSTGGIKIQWEVPPKYADPKTSGFTIDVKSGMEPVKLELKSK